MDLSLISQIASILGLGISFWTLTRVWNIRKLVASQQFNRTIISLMEDIARFPAAKQKLTKTNAEKVHEAVIYLEVFLVSRWQPKHSKARSLLKKLKTEMNCDGRTEPVQRDISLIRNELFPESSK